MLNIFILFFALIGLQDIVIYMFGVNNVAPTIFALPIIAVHGMVFLCYLLTRKNGAVGKILAAALLLRIALMFCDFFHLFPILNSGADSEYFHYIAMSMYRGGPNFTNSNYPEFLAPIYKITFASRLLAQYINVLFGMGMIVMVYKSLRLLDINKKAVLISVAILSFLPNAIIFSGILLREAWVEFFVAVSAFYFIKWFVEGGPQWIVVCLAALLTASYMHAGILGLAVGYILAFICYNPRTGKVTFSTTSVVSMIAVTVVWLLVADYFEMFTVKFNSFDFDSNEDFLKKVNTQGGGNADYLTWIDADSTVQGLLFSPLKMFYFLFSPLPTEWNRIIDIIGFAIDGAIYMAMCWAIWKYRPGMHLYLKRFLVLAMLCSAFIFGYGTFNAGTAFRHRAKLLSVIAIPFAISISEGKEKKYYTTRFVEVEKTTTNN